MTLISLIEHAPTIGFMFYGLGLIGVVFFPRDEERPFG